MDDAESYRTKPAPPVVETTEPPKNLEEQEVKRKSKPTSLTLQGEIDIAHESPKTPTTHFTKSVIDNGKVENSCCFDCFVLSFWDNIVGPRTAHVWKIGEKKTLSRNILQSIAARSLGGELSNGALNSHVDIKILVLQNKLVGYSYIFEALGGMLHSLTVVVPPELKAELEHLQELVKNWMLRLVGKLRVMLQKEELESTIALFSMELYHFSQVLKSINSAALPDHILLDQTFLHPNHECPRPFLKKAFLAHLLTGGHSLVLSSCQAQANMMISTLALLLSATERKSCHYVSDTNVYHPEVMVQGIVQASVDLSKIQLESLDLSQFPTAVIMMDTGQVGLSGYIHQHVVNHHAALQRELHSVWTQKMVNTTVNSIKLITPQDTETIVSELLKDLDLIPPPYSLMGGYIKNFMMSIRKRAFSLIKYMDMITNSGKTKNIPMNRNRIRQELGYNQNTEDFKIVLAAAEKMRPDIYGYLYQDRIQTYVHVYGFNTGRRAGDNDDDVKTDD